MLPVPQGQGELWLGGKGLAEPMASTDPQQCHMAGGRVILPAARQCWADSHPEVLFLLASVMD